MIQDLAHLQCDTGTLANDLCEIARGMCGNAPESSGYVLCQQTVEGFCGSKISKFGGTLAVMLVIFAVI